MNKVSVVIIAILLLAVGLSGCTDSNQQSGNVESSLNYVVSDTYASRDADGYINFAYVEIQNHGDEDISLTVNFQIAYLNIDRLGEFPYGGGKSGETSIWDDAEHSSERASVRAHDIKKVYLYPRFLGENMKPLNWKYEITS